MTHFVFVTTAPKNRGKRFTCDRDTKPRLHVGEMQWREEMWDTSRSMGKASSKVVRHHAASPVPVDGPPRDWAVHPLNLPLSSLYDVRVAEGDQKATIQMYMEYVDSAAAELVRQRNRLNDYLSEVFLTLRPATPDDCSEIRPGRTKAEAQAALKEQATLPHSPAQLREERRLLEDMQRAFR